MIGMVPLVLVLGVMGSIRSVESAVLPMVLVSVAAFLMMGPYSFLTPSSLERLRSI